MSTRTYALSLKSLDPIRDAIASKDENLYKAVIADFDADDTDRQSYARSMIFAETPPAQEPGCWNYIVEPLAKHFGLDPTFLQIDDWKHYAAWEEYRKIAASRISEDALALLRFIESGRPFRGDKIDHDGCLFGWLTNAESAALLAALGRLDGELFADVDLDELHEELIESLQNVVDGGTEMFIGAS